MKGNFHVPFLEGWGPVTASGYSASEISIFFRCKRTDGGLFCMCLETGGWVAVLSIITMVSAALFFCLGLTGFRLT